MGSGHWIEGGLATDRGDGLQSGHVAKLQPGLLPHGLHRLLSTHSAFSPPTTSAVNVLLCALFVPFPLAPLLPPDGSVSGASMQRGHQRVGTCIRWPPLAMLISGLAVAMGGTSPRFCARPPPRRSGLKAPRAGGEARHRGGLL